MSAKVAKEPETARMEPPKVSSAAIFERFDQIQGRLDQLLTNLYRPQPLTVYKPKGDTEGAALKLQLRLVPTYAGAEYPESVSGGLFVELVGQTGKDPAGFTKFGWQEDDKITAKLGLPDISAMLAAYRNVRLRGKPTPENTRTKGDTDGVTVSMFHRFDTDTAVLEWRLDATGSFFRISKSKDWNRSIRLSLQEEVQLETYLQRALSALQSLGCR